MNLEAGPTSGALGAGRRFRRNLPLQALVAGYAVLWLLAAVSPYDRFDWFLENLLVFLWVPVLVLSYRRTPLSNLAYALIAAFLSLHTLGSHYTYSLAPPGFWIQEAMELDRNHYDRMVHFSFGLLLFTPLREAVSRSAGLRGYWTLTLPLAVNMAFSSLYEILEWAVARIVSPETGLAFLGTQGDVFDAQKDTALAAVGAAIAAALTLGHARWRAERGLK
jgi:putative membrane protein